MRLRPEPWTAKRWCSAPSAGCISRAARAWWSRAGLSARPITSSGTRRGGTPDERAERAAGRALGARRPRAGRRARRAVLALVVLLQRLPAAGRAAAPALGGDLGRQPL